MNNPGYDEAVFVFAKNVVSAGAGWLDTKRPNWWLDVDAERLDVYSGNHCPLGQLFGDSDDWPRAYRTLAEMTGLERDSRALAYFQAEHGFNSWWDTPNSPTANTPWELLNDLWREAIAERRALPSPA